MPSLKTCRKISDLVCENCIYAVEKFGLFVCGRETTYSLDVVKGSETCGQGQWYCELHRSLEDPPGPPVSHRCCSKVAAVSSFLDRERETVGKEGEIKYSPYPSADAVSIVEALRNAGIDWGNKAVMLENLRIVPKTIFKTDVTVEFTVKADIWRAK